MNQAETKTKKSAVARPQPDSRDLFNSPDDEIVAYVEIDRFCSHCGYNLRTQPVSRDDRTRLLVTRCPECGGFEAASGTVTAASPWLNRLATLGLLIWILALLWAMIGLSIAQGAVSYSTLEELTRWTSGRSGRVVTPHFELYGLFMAVMGATSFALGFLALQLIAVVCHHWRRVGYAALALLQCLAVSAVVWAMWVDTAPNLMEWGEKYIGGLALLRLAGAMSAMWLGRPLARLIVRVALPPRARQVLAFLWFADGLHPPRKPTAVSEFDSSTAAT